MLGFASPIVDTSALWKIIAASLAGGAGCAIAFGILLIGLSRAQQTDNGGVRVLSYGIVLVAGLFCLAAVVLGIHAMTTKSCNEVTSAAGGSFSRVTSADPEAAHKTSLRVACLHNPDHDDLAAQLQKQGFSWIDLEEPSDDDLERLAKLISLHPLTLQDARTFQQRPKIEEYDGYMFMVVFGVDEGTESGGPLLREFHLIISGDYVITVHRRPFEPLADLRKRYNDEPIRSEQFLVYKVLDAVISTFVPVLSRTDDDIDDVEQQVIDNPTQEELQRIFALKRDLVAMRRVVSPMRDMFARNSDRISELPGLETDDRLYFRDLYDTLIRVSELVDSYRDLLSGATDMYLSTVANRQGEVNKQLTIIATVFLPLTFLTGFFGQNFAYLTGHIINHDWTFWVFGIGLLVASAIGFRIYFKRKRWI